MNFKAKILRADSTMEFIEPKNGTDFQCEELQAYVGGFIEIVRPPGQTGVLFVLNEEGKLNGLPINLLATLAWQEGADPESMRVFDPIVGNVVVCHESQVL